MPSKLPNIALRVAVSCCVLAWIHVAPVDADETTARAEVDALLGDLRKAIDEEDFLAVGNLFDVNRLVAEFERAVAKPEGKPGDAGSELSQLDRVILGASLRAETLSLAWARHEIRSFALTAGGEAAAAVVKHWDDDGMLGSRLRWFLARYPSGWRIYDIEDLELGFRWSTLLVGGVRTAREDGSAVNAFRAIASAVEQLEQESPEEALEVLADVDATELSAALAGVVHILRASAHVAMFEPREAVKACAAAREVHPDAPIVDFLEAVALNEIDEHEAALQSARRYVESLGPDADAFVEIGTALEGLDRRAEALEAYRAGLADDPSSVECLAGLARTLPRDRYAELAERFAAIPNGPARFDEIAGWLYDIDEGMVALEVLVGALEKRVPDDPNVAYYRADIASIRGEHEAAAKILAAVLPRVVDSDELAFYEQAYVDAMRALGRTIEAFETMPVKSSAFRLLALEFLGEWEAEPLEALVAKYRPYAKDDPILPVVEACIARIGDDHERALALAVSSQSAVADDDDFVGYNETILVRSALDLQRFDVALAAARASTERDGDPYYEAVVHCLAGRPRDAVRLMDECVREHGYDLGVFFEDAQAGDAFKKLALDALLEKYGGASEKGGAERQGEKGSQ